MSHHTHMNKSCHTYERDMPHLWMSHATHINDSCHTHEWVMPHPRISHIKHTNKLYQKHRWVLSHVQNYPHTIIDAKLCVALCRRICRVLQSVAEIGQRTSTDMTQKCALQCVAMCCWILQCVAVCCSVLQCAAVCCSVLQCVTIFCSVLQCVAVCCRICTRTSTEAKFETCVHTNHRCSLPFRGKWPEFVICRRIWVRDT